MQTLQKSRKQIAFHYDVPSDFYGLWLDSQMIYSCAYFKTGKECLDEAQSNKLDLICRKLRLKPNERLLDIGCGWGGLMVHAAKNYGVKARGITLSREQFHFVNDLIQRKGLSSKCEVFLTNYRELGGENVYDKLVSVGMFEHVGINNLDGYFAVAHRLLKDRGLFLNHGITKKEKWRSRNPSSEFLEKHIFPGGQLDQLHHVVELTEKNDFEILDVESLRPHYAITLRRWVERLQARKSEALQIVDEETYRKWIIFMAASAVAFEDGSVSVFQVLASKQATDGLSRVPLTRADIYETEIMDF